MESPGSSPGLGAPSSAVALQLSVRFPHILFCRWLGKVSDWERSAFDSCLVPV